MKYEVQLDNFVHYCEAGNQWQACIETLREYIERACRFPRLVPFQVKNLETGNDEEIGMSEVLGLINLSANCEIEE